MEYTAEQFHQAVLDADPETAVFDCDGTLWAPDSGQAFMDWSLAQKLVSPEREAWILERYSLYEQGQVDEIAICGEMVQLYAGLPEALVIDAARTFVREHVLPFIFPEMLALVRALHARGVELWAVSSTNRWVVEAGVWAGGASAFGILPERILAADIAVATGPAGERLVTDTLLAVPSDEAKAAALVAAGLPRPDVVFGNSVHDAAMLGLARKAFAVNPRPALASIAGTRGWARFFPRVAPGTGPAQPGSQT